jgi:hypothetical protein
MFIYDQLVPQLIDLYKQGKFPVDRLAKIYTPETFEDAIHDLHSGTVRIPIETSKVYTDISVKVIKPIIKWTDQ